VLSKNKADPQSRAFWEHVERTARRVAEEWPQWKLDLVGVERRRRGNMRMRLFFDGQDSRCLKLAERLVAETEAEIVHSDGMRPTLWLNGVVYYGLEDIEAALHEAGVPLSGWSSTSA
jgi:hypothetical protein